MSRRQERSDRLRPICQDDAAVSGEMPGGHIHYCIESLETRRLFAATLADVIGQDLSAVYTARSQFTASTTTAAGTRATGAVSQTPIPGANLPNRSLLRIDGDRIQVQVTSKGNTAALAKSLAKVGGKVISKFGRVVDVSVPVAALANLPALADLKSARPSYKPTLNAGKVEDQAVQSLKSDIGGTQFGVDGTGVTIGIISDSYNNLGGAAADVASGDLPASVNVVKELGSGGTDEGRAMAQLIHDVAPGASIAFYTAFVSESDFANGIVQLAKPVAQGGAGCKVIVDDVGYFDEPIYQDGIVAQAVNTAVNTYGVSYFSAAGNSGRAGYESPFNSLSTTISAVTGAPSTYHNFNPSGTADPYQPISITANTTFRISLQWDQPYASAGGAGSASNVDAYLLNSTKTSLVALATTNNITSGDPTEILSYTPASSGTYYLVIRLRTGAAPGAMKYVMVGAGTIAGYTTNSGTSFGHPMAAGAAGVGAAWYNNTPAFGASSPSLESYSSAGGTPILFSSNGTRLVTPDLRQEPRFTSIDGTNTTFFAQSAVEGNGLHSFFGTSAAAPHAAAVAALLKQAVPSLTATQIYAALQNTATDMNAAGFDFDSGYGLIQADKALAAVAASSISGNIFRDYNNNGSKDGGDPALTTAVFLDSNTNGSADSGSSGTLSSSDVPKSITDGTTGTPSRVTSSLTVSGLSGRVSKVTVSLNVSHAKPSDLGLTLISPSGMRIPLFSNVGANQGAVGDGYNITLDDSAGSSVPYNPGSGSITGIYKPQVKLAGLVGENPNGTWKLEARDFITGNIGTINSWSLNINYAETSTTSDATGNYSFAGLTPSTYYGTYNVRQAVPSGLTQTVPSSPYNLNVSSASTSTSNFADFAPLATIASTVVDDGSGQRSAVRSYTVTFNGVIPQANIQAGAFSILQTTGTIAAVNTNVSSVTVLGGTQTAVVLTFSGDNIIGGSLADGHYTLTVDGSKIVDSTGAPADPAGTGSPGTSATRAVNRYFGDVTGDGFVNNSDAFAFKNTYGLNSANGLFVSALDFDGDGNINNIDAFQFKSRYGTTAP